MRPMAAAAIGALVSGVAMYAVGARAQQNPFAEMPALVQTVDGQLVQVPGAKPLGYSNAFVSGAQEFCNRRGMNYLLANNQTPVKDLIGSYLRRRGLVR